MLIIKLNKISTTYSSVQKTTEETMVSIIVADSSAEEIKSTTLQSLKNSQLVQNVLRTIRTMKSDLIEWVSNNQLCEKNYPEALTISIISTALITI